MAREDNKGTPPDRNYLVNHTQVGPFENGRIVSEATLLGLGADLGHLLQTNAIVPTKEEITMDPVDIGPENPGTIPLPGSEAVSAPPAGEETGQSAPATATREVLNPSDATPAPQGGGKRPK